MLEKISSTIEIYYEQHTITSQGNAMECRRKMLKLFWGVFRYIRVMAVMTSKSTTASSTVLYNPDPIVASLQWDFKMVVDYTTRYFIPGWAGKTACSPINQWKKLMLHKISTYFVHPHHNHWELTKMFATLKGARYKHLHVHELEGFAIVLLSKLI